MKRRIWFRNGKQVIFQISFSSRLCYRNSEKAEKPVHVSFSPVLLTPPHRPTPSFPFCFLGLGAQSHYASVCLPGTRRVVLASPSYQLSLILSSASHNLRSVPSLQPCRSQLGTLHPAALSLASLLQHLFATSNAQMEITGKWMAGYHVITCKSFTLSLYSPSIKVSAWGVPCLGLSLPGLFRLHGTYFRLIQGSHVENKGRQC